MSGKLMNLNAAEEFANASKNTQLTTNFFTPDPEEALL
jgi:hypothetical protein